MDFVNETTFAAGWTLGFERDGRELLIVAAKATYSLPAADSASVTLAETQIPLTKADVFTGEPGFSAPRYECDYAHRKPACDVLLNASAYAPHGRPTRRVEVEVAVGAWTKSLAVVGNRVWHKGVFGLRATAPDAFMVQPISYDFAFGGIDDSRGDSGKLKTYLRNPVGRGYRPYRDNIDGSPLPNTEEMSRAITDPDGAYEPMAFGPLGRSWQPRVAWAGTYDTRWMNQRAPFWPDDFDYRYFQAAPVDQQIPYPRGGELVVLRNLTPSGLVQFNLPEVTLPVLFIPQRGEPFQTPSAVDTVLIEPDEGRFSLTWRVAHPLRRNCFELKQVIVGGRSREWLMQSRAEAKGKTYYRNLAELARQKGRGQ